MGALLGAELRAARRGGAARSATAALAGALAAVAVVVCASVGHELAVGARPAAAAGLVDLAFAALFVTAVAAPVSGGAAQRVLALARASAAPLDGRTLAAAAGLRELAAAPAGPAALCGAALAAGSGAAHGAPAACVGALAALLLAAASVALGLLVLGLAGSAYAARARVLVAVGGTLLVVALVPEAPHDVGETAAWLAALHARADRLVALPPWWAAACATGAAGPAALGAAGLLASAAAAWTCAARVLGVAPPRPARPQSSRTWGAGLLARLPGSLGALAAKDVAVGLRDPALHVRAARLALPGGLALVGAVAVAWTSPDGARRLLPSLHLVTLPLAAALGGVALRFHAQDGAGLALLARTPVGPFRVALAKGLAWCALTLPLLVAGAASTAAAVAVAGGLAPWAPAAWAALGAACASVAAAGAALAVAAACRVAHGSAPSAAPGLLPGLLAPLAAGAAALVPLVWLHGGRGDGGLRAVAAVLAAGVLFAAGVVVAALGSASRVHEAGRARAGA